MRKKALFSVCTVLMLLIVFCATSHTATLQLAPDTTWIPTNTNTCAVTVNLTDAPGNSTLTFQLISTNWPGHCMNRGDRRDKTPDLKLLSSQASNAEAPASVTLTWARVGDSLTVTWGNTAPTSLILKVNSYDYGAIGKINAGLYNGGDAQGQPQYIKASTMIPYATGNSQYIAAAQKSQTGWIGWNGTEMEDAESGPPENTYPGDGLTAFEEYRGFEVNKDRAHGWRSLAFAKGKHRPSGKYSGKEIIMDEL